MHPQHGTYFREALLQCNSKSIPLLLLLYECVAFTDGIKPWLSHLYSHSLSYCVGLGWNLSSCEPLFSLAYLFSFLSFLSFSLSLWLLSLLLLPSLYVWLLPLSVCLSLLSFYLFPITFDVKKYVGRESMVGAIVVWRERSEREFVDLMVTKQSMKHILSSVPVMVAWDGWAAVMFF